MIKNNLLALSFLLSVFIFAQEEVEEIPIEEQRNNKIKELLQTVETNKSIYIQEDQKIINEFLDLIDERQNMLSKAKTDLENEKQEMKDLKKNLRRTKNF